MTVLATALLLLGLAGPGSLDHAGRSWPLYPTTTATCPDLPSPLVTEDGREYVVIELADGTYGLADVTRRDHERQVYQHLADFPELGRSGRHDRDHLASLTHISGLPVATIDSLAAPGCLSTGGFVAADESVRSVLLGDDALVAAMGLTHAELAAPLFHLWNLMQADLDLGRWNMARHRWCNVHAMKYHGQWVLLDAHDTKGGQRSPFGDGLDGAFWMVFRRPLSADEEAFLHTRYYHAGPGTWDEMCGTLSRLWVGEMEGFYIQWYGFYEGHTDWRADPLGIARIFGLRSIEELEASFPDALHRVTTAHHLAEAR